MVAETTGESGESVGKGTNIIIPDADQTFDFNDREWYCYFRQQYDYEPTNLLSGYNPELTETDIGSGEFVLPAEYMDLDFVVRGDDNKLVSIFGDLYDENTYSVVQLKNLATKNNSKTGNVLFLSTRRF